MIRENIINDLITRKKDMQISNNNISKISGVSIATVKRTFCGNHTSLDSIEKIAHSLGYYFEIKTIINLSTKKMYELQVEKKAEEIVKKILKTSALENQSLDNETVDYIMNNAIKAVKQIPKSSVWE